MEITITTQYPHYQELIYVGILDLLGKEVIHKENNNVIVNPLNLSDLRMVNEYFNQLVFLNLIDTQRVTKKIKFS
jgi:hypothetical protein